MSFKAKRFKPNEIAKIPSDWEEFPQELWENILQYLPAKKIRDLRCVSRTLYKIVNLIPTQLYLKTYEKYDLGSFQNSQIYEKVVLVGDRIMLSVQDESRLLEIFQQIGGNVKFLTLDNLEQNREFLIKLLGCFPNIEILNASNVIVYKFPFHENLSPIEFPNLKTLHLEECHNFGAILQYFTGSSLKKIEIRKNFCSNGIAGYVKHHERNLKELTLSSYDEHQNEILFSSFKEMRLEYLNLKCNLYTWNRSLPNKEKFLMFLRQHDKHLKFLSLSRIHVFSGSLNVIFENLKNLETLIIDTENWNVSDQQVTDKIRFLKKLRHLKFYGALHADYNILNGLRFEINRNLVELEGNFQFIVTDDFMMDLARCLPNLKKLTMRAFDQKTVEYMLKYLKNLEVLRIQYIFKNAKDCFRLDEACMVNLKHLHMADFSMTTENAEKFASCFPNLVTLQIDCCKILTDNSVEILLKGLKYLKVVSMEDNDRNMRIEKIKDSIRKYGQNLCYLKISLGYFCSLTGAFYSKKMNKTYSC